MQSEKVKNRLDLMAKSALSSLETVYNSYNIASRCIDEGIPGAFVECGVAAGTQIAAMRYAAMQKQVARRLVLADSFEGIPLAGPKDTEQPGVGPITHDVNVPMRELLVSSGVASVSEDVVKSRFRGWGIPLTDTQFIKGWFEDTMPGLVLGDIAILRLDGDLYSATKVCLDNLYSQVVPGGFVIVDDYELGGCRIAVDEFMGDKFDYEVTEGTGGAIWWRKGTEK